MKNADSFRDFAVEQLQQIRGLACRPMFGGYGLYAVGKFFGIMFKGRLYFKVSDASKPQYASEGMKPFRPSATMTLKSFYEVPADVLESADRMTDWAATAIRAAN